MKFDRTYRVLLEAEVPAGPNERMRLRRDTKISDYFSDDIAEVANLYMVDNVSSIKLKIRVFFNVTRSGIHIDDSLLMTIPLNEEKTWEDVIHSIMFRICKSRGKTDKKANQLADYAKKTDNDYCKFEITKSWIIP